MFLMNPNFLLAHRNRYSEGMDDAQQTPRGHPDFNSYVQNLRVFIFQTDRQTDEQMNRQRNTLAMRGLEELFFRCLRKVSPAPQRSKLVWYIVLEFHL
jgi:hypothetical protein